MSQKHGTHVGDPAELKQTLSSASTTVNKESLGSGFYQDARTEPL